MGNGVATYTLINLIQHTPGGVHKCLTIFILLSIFITIFGVHKSIDKHAY